jgi:O-antigen/teichoic acid export membrane protein
MENGITMTSAAKPSLRSNTLYSAAANGVFGLTQWAMVIVVARLGTTAEVGVITVITALITPIFMFAQMAMRDGHSVDDLEEFTRADYVALRVVSSFAALALSGLVIFTYLPSSGSLAQGSAAAFALVKLMGAQTNMNHGIFQRAERLDYVALSIISRGIFGLAAFAAAYWATGMLALAFLAEALAWWICLWTVDRRFLNVLHAHVSWRTAMAVPWRRITKLAQWMLPLGVAIFLMTAAASVPRLVLERYVDLSVVGIFGAIAYINVALNTVSSAIGTASAARLRRLYREGAKKRFLRLSVKLTLLSGALGVLIWLAALIIGKSVLQVLYGSDYARSDIFQLAILAAALRITAAPLQFAMTAGQAFWRRLSNNSMTFLVAVVASFALIPTQGAVGAAWAMVIPSAISLVLTALAFVQVTKQISAPSSPSAGQ